MYLLVGTLTTMGGAGIGLVKLENDHLSLLWSDDRLYNPIWQEISPAGRVFTTHSDRNKDPAGMVSELRITTSGMDILFTQSTSGNGPAHLTLSTDGHYLLCGNYNSGNLSVFPIIDAGIGDRLQLI